MRREWDGEPEMEARAVAHQRVTGGEIGMQRERRLHIGESRDDNAPNTLRGIERQNTLMAVDQASHHLSFARRPERGPALLRLLHGDEAVDDLAALHQQVMHRSIDAVDLAPQIGKRWFV